jgi:hypothetical protein
MQDDPRHGSQATGTERPASLWQSVRRHPVISVTLISCALIGAALGYTYLTADWSVARRIAAGAVAGAGTGLLITATKMLG